MSISPYNPSQWELIRRTITNKDDIKKLTISSGKLEVKSLFSFFSKILKKPAPIQQKKIYFITQNAESYFNHALEELQSGRFQNENLQQLKENLKVLDSIIQYQISKSKSSKNIEVADWLLKKNQKLTALKKEIRLEIQKFELKCMMQQQDWEGVKSQLDPEADDEIVLFCAKETTIFLEEKSISLLKKICIDRPSLIWIICFDTLSLKNPDLNLFFTHQLKSLSLKNAFANCEKLITRSQWKSLEKFLDSQDKRLDFEDLLVKTLLELGNHREKDAPFCLKNILEKYKGHLSNDQRTNIIIDIRKGENKPIFKILSEILFPETQYNTFLANHCRAIIQWIYDPKKTMVPHRKKHVEASSEEETLSILVQRVLKLSDGNIIRMPQYFEVFNYDSKTKNSSFLLALFECLYKFRSSVDIQKRARLVINKFGKHDSFLLCLIDHCDRLVQKGALSDSILKNVKKLIDQGHYSIPHHELKSHRVSKKRRHLLNPLIGNIPKIEKRANNAIWHMKHLYYGGRDEKIEDLILNLEKIGIQEGFDVERFIIKNPWVRDVAFTIPSGALLVPQTNPEAVSPFAHFKKILPIDCTNYTDPDPVFVDPLLGRVYHEKTKGLFMPEVNLGIFNVQRSHFYFEGGNLLKAQNKEGKNFVICGAMNLLASFLVSNQQRTFDKAELKDKLEKKVKSLETQGIYTQTLIEETKKVLNECQIMNDEKNAREAIAKIEVIKDVLQEELEMPVIFLESEYGFNQKQLGLHLDMVMLSAPNGVIFLEDHEKSIELLEALLNSQKLNKAERHCIKEFLKNSKALNKRDKPRLNAIWQQLESYGFQMIPTPSRFLSANYKINYMNAIPGNGKTGDFIITSGFSGIPGESYLRDAVTLTFQAGGIDSVYFTGHPSVYYLDSARSDMTSHFNLDKGGSIHCRTLETL